MHKAEAPPGAHNSRPLGQSIGITAVVVPQSPAHIISTRKWALQYGTSFDDGEFH